MSLKGKLFDLAARGPAKGILKWFINRKIEDFGEVLEFKIDKTEKSISVNVLLKGETRPVEIIIHHFELIHRDDQAFIQILKAECDREWMDKLLQIVLIGKDVKIPEGAYKILQEVID